VVPAHRCGVVHSRKLPQPLDEARGGGFQALWYGSLRRTLWAR
jgi:hypothetical protein